VAIERRDAPGRSLEGIYVIAPDEGGAVVAPPHPLYGGSMDSPVVNEVAYACSRAGLSSLRFNWRGVGASSGAPSGDAADADHDYDSALAHLEETVPGALVACGYSFGAAAALRAAAHPRVVRLVLVAPPPALASAEALAGVGKRMLVLAGEHDRLAPPDALREALGQAPHATLAVVPGADHFFGAGLADLARLTSAWLG